jgi:hypothetical protein
MAVATQGMGQLPSACTGIGYIGHAHPNLRPVPISERSELRQIVGFQSQDTALDGSKPREIIGFNR